MQLLKSQFSILLLISLILAHSACLSSSWKLNNSHLKKLKFVKVRKVSVKLSRTNFYLSKYRLLDFEEYRNWTIFKTTSGKKLFMLGIHFRGDLYEFLSYHEGLLTLSDPQSVDLQKHRKVFQLVEGKLMHYSTEEYFCSKEKLCKHWKRGNFVELK